MPSSCAGTRRQTSSSSDEAGSRRRPAVGGGGSVAEHDRGASPADGTARVSRRGFLAASRRHRDCLLRAAAARRHPSRQLPRHRHRSRPLRPTFNWAPRRYVAEAALHNIGRVQEALQLSPTRTSRTARPDPRHLQQQRGAVLAKLQGGGGGQYDMLARPAEWTPDMVKEGFLRRSTGRRSRTRSTSTRSSRASVGPERRVPAAEGLGHDRVSRCGPTWSPRT